MASRTQLASSGRNIDYGFDVTSRPPADSPTDSILRAYNEFGIDEEGLSTTVSGASMAEKATNSSRNRALAVAPYNEQREAPVGMDAGGLPSHQARALLQRSNRPWLNRAESKILRPLSPASRRRAHSTSQGPRYQVGQPELARMIGPYPDFALGHTVGRHPASARSDGNLRYASSAASNSSHQPSSALSVAVRHPAHRRGPSPAMTEPEPSGQDGSFVSRTPSAASTNIVHARERHHKTYHSRPRWQPLGLPKSPLPSYEQARSPPQHRLDAPVQVKQQICRNATASVVSITPSINQDAKFWDYSEGYMDVVGLYAGTSSDEQSHNSAGTTPTKAEAENTLYNANGESLMQVPHPLQTSKENKPKAFQSPKPMPSPRTMQKRLSAWNRSQDLQNCLKGTKVGDAREEGFKAELDDSVMLQNDCDGLGIAYELRTNFQRVRDRLARELAKKNEPDMAETFENHDDEPRVNPSSHQNLHGCGSTDERDLRPNPDQNYGELHLQNVTNAQTLANQSREVHRNSDILRTSGLQSDMLTCTERQDESPRLSYTDSEDVSSSLGTSERVEMVQGLRATSSAVAEEVSIDIAERLPSRTTHEEAIMRNPQGNRAFNRTRQLREVHEVNRKSIHDENIVRNRPDQALRATRKAVQVRHTSALGNDWELQSVPHPRDDGGGRPDSDTLPIRAQPAPPPPYPPPPPPTLGFSSPDIYSRVLGFPLRTSSKKAPELSDVTEESTLASHYHSSRSDINNAVHSPRRPQLSNYKNWYVHNIGAQLEIPESERVLKSCNAPSENDSDASVDRMELGFRNAFPTVDDAYDWTESSNGRNGGAKTNSSTGIQEMSQGGTASVVVCNCDGFRKASSANARECMLGSSQAKFPKTGTFNSSCRPSRIEVTDSVDVEKHTVSDEVRTANEAEPCGMGMTATPLMDQAHGGMPEIRIIPPSTTERSSGYSRKSKDAPNEDTEPHRGLRHKISHGLIGKALRSSQSHLRARAQSSNEDVYDDDVQTAVDRVVYQRSQPSIMRRFRDWLWRTADRIKNHKRSARSRMLQRRSFRNKPVSKIA